MHTKMFDTIEYTSVKNKEFSKCVKSSLSTIAKTFSIGVKDIEICSFNYAEADYESATNEYNPRVDIVAKIHKQGTTVKLEFFVDNGGLTVKHS